MRHLKIKESFSIIILLVLFGLTIYGQDTKITKINGSEINTITTAVPFLTITPDSRSSGMGDAGVSSTPDAFSMHSNPAKYAFIENNSGFSLSYTPWLKSLVNDINMAYITFYQRLNHKQTIASSFRYFSLGEVTFTTITGEEYYTTHPVEMALDVAYSYQFTPDFSGGIAARYIRSNLTEGQYVGGNKSHVGWSLAADVSLYYQKIYNIGPSKGKFAFGLNISNIGSKISYIENFQKDFIPINLRLGPSFTMEFNKYNSLAFLFDINKLLVPTPPIYGIDTTNGEILILKGKDPNRSVASGMFGSFSDAPGGASEELNEITYSLGLEYMVYHRFFFRCGYFYEHPTKGNRKYFTLGTGLKIKAFAFDVSYLLPVEQRNPLENTFSFSLSFNFGKSLTHKIQENE